MKVLCFSGSFHSKSRSLAILRHIKRSYSEVDFEIVELEHLPFFNPDINLETHEELKVLYSKVSECDGLICCLPEYNHSIPAVIKNAIDWVSRPAFHSPLKEKPVSIITQSMNNVGGVRAQAHLKLILDSTLSVIHRCYEMAIPQVSNIFDDNMMIIDETSIRRLDRHIHSFLDFIAVHKHARSSNF